MPEINANPTHVHNHLARPVAVLTNAPFLESFWAIFFGQFLKSYWIYKIRICIYNVMVVQLLQYTIMQVAALNLSTVYWAEDNEMAKKLCCRHFRSTQGFCCSSTLQMYSLKWKQNFLVPKFLHRNSLQGILFMLQYSPATFVLSNFDLKPCPFSQTNLIWLTKRTRLKLLYWEQNDSVDQGSTVQGSCFH